MEINDYEKILAVVAGADVVEGKMVVLDAVADSYDFGSREDLPKVRVPATAEEANRARYVVTWPVTNMKPPFYQPQPAFDWALRDGGFDQDANLPMTNTTVYFTWPGYQNGVTIPSGTPCLAFGEGIYTVPSGAYIYNAAMRTPGTLLEAANTAEDTTDAGKLKYLSAASTRAIAEVIRFNTSTWALTFRILY